MPVQTPSTHRQRLAVGNGPTARTGHAIRQPSVINRTPSLPPQRISPRQPLASLSGNHCSPSGFAGYGMSAGLKVSNSTGAAIQGLARASNASRGLKTLLSRAPIGFVDL